MTDTLLAPQHEFSTDTSLLHWCCVRVADAPFIALCGALLEGRRSWSPIACPDCDQLAAEHTSGCKPCALWATR